MLLQKLIARVGVGPFAADNNPAICEACHTMETGHDAFFNHRCKCGAMMRTYAELSYNARAESRRVVL